MKFKVGDKVKVTKPCKGMENFLNAVGKVIAVDPGFHTPYHIQLYAAIQYDGVGWAKMYFLGRELTKVEE